MPRNSNSYTILVICYIIPVIQLAVELNMRELVILRKGICYCLNYEVLKPNQVYVYTSTKNQVSEKYIPAFVNQHYHTLPVNEWQQMAVFGFLFFVRKEILDHDRLKLQ